LVIGDGFLVWKRDLASLHDDEFLHMLILLLPKVGLTRHIDKHSVSSLYGLADYKHLQGGVVVLSVTTYEVWSHMNRFLHIPLQFLLSLFCVVYSLFLKVL
jgi:hypothetical protein